MTIFEDLGVDAIVVSGATNRRYFSGWSADDHAPDRPSGVMLITPDEKLLLSTSTNLPWAAAEALPGVTAIEMVPPWPNAIATLAKVRRVKSLGIEDAVLPVASYWGLQKALGEEVSLMPASAALDRQRQVKTPREQDLIREALRVTDEAFIASAAVFRSGLTEREFANIIEENFRALGSEGVAFDIIVASGPNAAKPHHAPGDRVIQDDEPVIVDMGARIGGYCGDLTRTIWSGQPDEQLGTMYRLVAKAQEAAIAAVRAGVPARDIDSAAREVFAAEGQDQLFAHSVGHAIGLRIHEAPFLSQHSNDVLEPGNVVTIEPGLYLPDWGGVRIEDVVLVTEDGCENLTGAPKLLGVGN